MAVPLNEGGASSGTVSLYVTGKTKKSLINCMFTHCMNWNIFISTEVIHVACYKQYMLLVLLTAD